MKGTKWKWKIDQWFEDKVWTRVPSELQSPHFFFLLGVITTMLMVFLINIIL